MHVVSHYVIELYAKHVHVVSHCVIELYAKHVHVVSASSLIILGRITIVVLTNYQSPVVIQTYSLP